MNPGRRAALFRVVTGATAVATAVLIWLHFTGREEEMRRARAEVDLIHEDARESVTRRVFDRVAALAAWTGDRAAPPEGFRKADVSTRPEGWRALARVKLRSHSPPVVVEEALVQTFPADPGITREGETTLGEAPWSVRLDFPADGDGTLRITATLAGSAPPGTGPIPVTASLVQGPLAEVTGIGEVTVDPAAGKAEATLDLRLREVLKGRPSLSLRKPPGTPSLKILWEARIGGSGEAEAGDVAIAVPLAGDATITVRAPERPGGPEKTLDQRAYAVGRVSLESLTRGITDRHPLRTADLGDRVYLTDAFGTVLKAIPDLPPKVGRRIRQGQEGRGALSSPATVRVRLGSAGTDTYEGFAKDQVVGTFGPLPAINGGLIVEREERLVLAPWRGLQAWHLTAILLGALLLYPLVPPVVRKIQEDTELPRLLSYARTYLPHMGAILAAATLYGGGKATFVYFSKVITDDVLLSAESTTADRLYEICWILVGVAGGMFVVAWIKEYAGKFIQNRLVVDLRCLLCDKIVQLPMSFHSRQRAGDLLSRIQNDVAETKRGLEMLFDDVMTEPVMLIIFVGTAFYINWRLALVVFIGLPIILVPISYFGKSIKRHARKRQAKRADVTHTINQMLSGIRVVKAFRMEDHESRRIREVSDDFLSEAMRVARSQVTSKEFLELINNLSAVLILALGGWLVLEDQVTLGDLMAFSLLMNQMYRSSKQLTSTYNKMQESLAGTERIFEVLDTPDDMVDRPAARALVRPRREIAFENVWFRYGEGQPWVLRDVSFRTPVGRTVALVGSTGAGKSTMLDLVARFYDPQQGRITIDGVELRDYSRTSLMSHIAVVTQEPFLFNASVAENLRYGRPGASQTELEAAARAAFVHEEILKQPSGYDTVVGERGGRLSGGQRQRLTIARAILKDPPILILDEATSALDSRAEKRVQDALGNLMKGRTTFVIAHRLSTIQHADRILVLEGGRIVEEGTHEELVRIPRGVYRHLYEIQFAAALGPDEPGSRSAAG